MRKNIKRMLVLFLVIFVLAGCSNQDKPSGETNSENVLTVATYNISSADREAQRKILADENVDIFGIQEVHFENISSLDKGIEKVNPLPEFTKDPYTDSYFGKAVDFAGGGYGIAVISDRELKDNTTTPLFMGDPSPEALEKFIDVYRAFDPTKPETRDAMNNMKSEGIDGEMVLEPRVYTRSIIDVDGKEVAFYNTHMSYEDDDIRHKQMEQLHEAMKADSAEYKIAVGDFNLLATSEMYIWKDDFTIANGNNGVWIDTFTVEYDSMYMYSIDNIIVSKNIELKDVKVVHSDLSDHLPLIAVLELK